ncbi:MAG: helix-turn-helix domain-containing protein [Burkholderiales bacterium]|nr:helix-turn-helix domain-containing protein [Burkholderiales bacterium]
MSRERDFVAALEKGLAVVEAFGPACPQLTLSEVAHRTGLTRAAARRYLLTLARLEYAEYDGKRFSLTPRVLRLGYAFLSTSPLPKLVQPVLEAIGEKTQEVASVAILDGADILFLAHSRNRRIVSVASSVGSRFPAYCTAIGRVLLAGRPEADVERFLRTVRPRKLTSRTKTGYRELLQAVATARQHGYAVCDEELELGLRSIAVPVGNSRGETVLGMSISLQTARMSAARMVEQLLPVLRAGGQSLSAML